jgi:hypothetical protein
MYINGFMNVLELQIYVCMCVCMDTGMNTVKQVLRIITDLFKITVAHFYFNEFAVSSMNISVIKQ